MIVDTLANADKYTSIHLLFAKAFEYIRAQNLAELKIGNFDVADGLKAIVAENVGITAAESIAEFECHNNNIDIQVCIRGHETIGWRPRNTCLSQRGDYDLEKDVVFYDDAPDMYFNLTNSQFAIFFPEDVHAPMIAVNDQPIKKLVMKVKI
jgi:YhcH/YjgK/YiaL family protein